MKPGEKAILKEIPMATPRSTGDISDTTIGTAHDSPDLAEADPAEITMRSEETDDEFARFEFTVHPSPDMSGQEDTLSHRRFIMDNPDEHVHPSEEEFIEVLSGEYGVAFEGTDHILAAGDEITVPMNTAHRHWNPTDQPIRVAHEHHPAARKSEAIFETLYALAQADRTDEKGIPNLLQFAVINKAYPGHVYRTDLPISVQKLLFTLLAPIGRLAGYEATYTRDDIEDLR